MARPPGRRRSLTEKQILVVLKRTHRNLSWIGGNWQASSTPIRLRALRAANRVLDALLRPRCPRRRRRDIDEEAA